MSILVTFDPLGLSVSCQEGESLFEAARRGNVPIPTACVGRGTCGLCRVKVLSGEAALSPLNSTEKRHLGTNYFITKLRLSCQTRVILPASAEGAVHVQIPDAAARQARSLAGADQSGRSSTGAPSPDGRRKPG